MKRLCWLAIAIPALVAGCGEPATETADQNGVAATGTEGMATDGAMAGAQQQQQQQQRAVAMLQTAQGAAAGQATATAADGGVMLALQVEGLPPGEHGVHVHTTGACDAPTFQSAGGHWNPTNAQHGLEDPAGQHAGDMPNLTVGEDGRGSLSYRLQGGTFEGLLDSDGSAFIIHASADDQRTDPSGNSGDRIACGVFKQN